jgi:DNA-binding transcriptional regulator GbsR (MarR family)
VPQDADIETRRAQFVEDFGVLFEQSGGVRMLGRVIGLLMIAEPPERTAEQLASELQASRGSISQTTRQLVQMGLVQRFTKPGERRDYFRIKPNGWTAMTRAEIRLIANYRELIGRGLTLVPGGEGEARRNIEHAVRFFDYVDREYRRFMDEWDQLEKERQ